MPAMLIAIWIVTLLLLGLWSALAWGLSALLATDGAWLAQIGPWLSHLPFGGWLETWYPSWLEDAHLLLSLLHNALAWLGGAAPTLVWVAWALGTAGLLLMGAGLTLIVVLVRKTMPPAQPPRAAAA